MKRPADLNDPKKGGRDGSKPIRYSIRFKIFIVSLLPTLALLAAALLNHQYLSSLGESADQILSQNYKSIRAAQQARKMLEETRNQLLEQIDHHIDQTKVSTKILERLQKELMDNLDNR